MQYKSTTGKLVLEFTNNPDADVKKLAKKYQIAPSYVYNIRKRTMQRLADNPLTPEQNEAMDTLVTTSQELGGWQATANTGALNVQVGGDHYKKMKIQPIEYIHANNLPFIEGNIVKYITRWREKNGLKDLEKVKHYVDLLIELEKLQ
jgi:hypothetical protein